MWDAFESLRNELSDAGLSDFIRGRPKNGTLGLFLTPMPRRNCMQGFCNVGRPLYVSGEHHHKQVTAKVLQVPSI